MGEISHPVDVRRDRRDGMAPVNAILANRNFWRSGKVLTKDSAMDGGTCSGSHLSGGALWLIRPCLKCDADDQSCPRIWCGDLKFGIHQDGNFAHDRQTQTQTKA